MSGIEVAGLVLGGFPLLISAAEHYKEGFEPLRKWKRFRSQFIGFIDAVDIEKNMFDATLERFLISADVPEEELQSFMTDPNYDGWYSEDLVEVLRSRLGPSYSVFMSTIKTLNETMADLQEILSLKNGEVDWASEGASKWDYQFKRISLSFSKKGEKKVAALETTNRKLRDLLETHEKRATARSTRKDVKWANIFECIRRHASSVHTALRKGWNCSCESSHNTALRLEQRNEGGWNSEFKVAFSISEDPIKHMAIRREVLIRTKNETIKSEMLQKAPVVSGQQQKLDQLRGNFESKSKTQVSVLPRPPLQSSLSDFSSHGASLRSIFSKKSSISSSTVITNSNGTEILIPDAKTSKMPLPHRTKTKKSVGFQKVQLSKASPIVESEPTVIPRAQPESAEIKDLCSTLRTSGTTSLCFGYLCDEENHRHEFVELDENSQTTSKTQSVSLEELLGNRRLNRRQRHIIATILASSLLQLGTTPWMTQKMEKGSIFFNQHDSKVDLEHPYIKHSFPSAKRCSPTQEDNVIPPPTRFSVRNSLANLGIILLELCFDQTIESHIYWGRYLVNGVPHEYTDYMTARDWIEIVGEQEPALEPIIRCCVLCVFEEKADWESKTFVQAVYGTVVAPLEKIIAGWSTS